MRRTLLLLTTMVVALLLASGVALAVNKVGTNGPDTLRGTNGDDNLLGRGDNEQAASAECGRASGRGYRPPARRCRSLDLASKFGRLRFAALPLS